MNLKELGLVLMRSFKMDGSHLSSFVVPVNLTSSEYLCRIFEEKGSCLGYRTKPSVAFSLQPEERDEWDEEPNDASSAILSDMMMHEKENMAFLYDFGDGWEVTVKLEKILPFDPATAATLPQTITGAGYGIIEDCGGPFGLMHIREVLLQGESHEEWDDIVDWIGDEDFDLDAF